MGLANGKIKLAFIMTAVIVLTGCEEVTGLDVEPLLHEASETSETSETLKFAFDDSFVWEYQGEETGIVFRLEDCDCLYESEYFRIYSKHMDYATHPYSSYPYSGELIYLQTPEQSMQLYPDEYVIDYESGTIYALYNEKDFFTGIYSYSAAANPVGEICGVDVIQPSLLEEWISKAYGLTAIDIEKTWEKYSNLRVNILSVSHEQGMAVLRGEASGIYQVTGETYHIEWELNTANCEEEVTSVMPRHYDEIADKEIFEACSMAFDKLEQGDEDKEEIQNERFWKARRMDVNGDGLPELIEELDANGLGISPIVHIYTYVDGVEPSVQEMFSDLIDMSEYYFVGVDGKLIYDYSDHGEMSYGSYSQYQFDENWDRKLVDRLEIYYFYDHYKEYEGEHEQYSENYPETYGARGSGYYFFRTRRKTVEELENSDTDMQEDLFWVREEISRQEFIKVYREMTGLDFFAVNTDFPHSE